MLYFDSGRAAFGRIWLLTPMTRSGQARQTGWRSTPTVVPTGFARMPAGITGSVGTLGGTGTAVSAHSAHREEAVALVRYQLRSFMQADETEGGSGGTAQTESSSPPTVGQQHNAPTGGSQARASIIARPSIPAGSKYKQLSRAYIDGVHSVLMGQREAADVAAELAKLFVEMTGFSAGPPK